MSSVLGDESTKQRLSHEEILQAQHQTFVHTVDGLAFVHTVDGLAFVHMVDGLAFVHTVDGLAFVHTVGDSVLSHKRHWLSIPNSVLMSRGPARKHLLP